MPISLLALPSSIKALPWPSQRGPVVGHPAGGWQSPCCRPSPAGPPRAPPPTGPPGLPAALPRALSLRPSTARAQGRASPFLFDDRLPSLVPVLALFGLSPTPSARILDSRPFFLPLRTRPKTCEFRASLSPLSFCPSLGRGARRRRARSLKGVDCRRGCSA